MSTNKINNFEEINRFKKKLNYHRKTKSYSFNRYNKSIGNLRSFK